MRPIFLSTNLVVIAIGHNKLDKENCELYRQVSADKLGRIFRTLGGAKANRRLYLRPSPQSVSHLSTTQELAGKTAWRQESSAGGSNLSVGW